MSALGHKQTFAAQNGVSALPPRADMCSAVVDVCYGPKADITPSIRSPHRRGQALMAKLWGRGAFAIVTLI